MSKYGEPWTPGDVGNATNDTLYKVHSFVRDAQGNILMGSWLGKDSPVLRRACICVRECAGIPDAALEGGVVREMVQALEEINKADTFSEKSYGRFAGLVRPILAKLKE